MFLLKNPLLIILVTISLFIGFFYFSLLSSHRRQVHLDINNYVSQWKYEISTNIFHKQNDKMVHKLLEGLKVFPISSYEVTINGQSTHKWPQNSSNCENPLENLLTLKGLFLGKVKICLSEQQIIQMSLFSPTFISMILVAAFLIAGASLFPLFGYKKSLISTMNLLKEWSLSSEKQLKIPSSDKVTNEIASLVRQGVNLRMDLNKARMERDSAEKISKITKQVAHDILSPAMALDIAMKSSSQIPQPQSNLIASSIRRIVETSHDLLNFEDQSQYKSHNPTPLFPLVDEVIKEKKSLYKNINFTYEIPKDIAVICHPSDLKRVFSNMINNSIEAISHNSGLISCQASVKDNICKMTLKDNGQGIPNEHLEEVFDEDFTHGKKEGRGLGLYYVKEKIKEWGGSIQIQSQINQGTCIHFYLKSKCLKEIIT